MISKYQDDWLAERYESETRWIATLSNGESVIQDDYRPGVFPESAWLRLKKYCEDNNVFVTNLNLQFRSHIECAANNCDGIYFCRAILASMFNQQTPMYNVGVIRNNKVFLTKWRTPELIVVGNEEREIEDCKDLIIWNQQK